MHVNAWQSKGEGVRINRSPSPAPTARQDQLLYILAYPETPHPTRAMPKKLDCSKSSQSSKRGTQTPQLPLPQSSPFSIQHQRQPYQVNEKSSSGGPSSSRVTLPPPPKPPGQTKVKEATASSNANLPGSTLPAPPPPPVHPQANPGSHLSSGSRSGSRDGSRKKSRSKMIDANVASHKKRIEELQRQVNELVAPVGQVWREAGDLAASRGVGPPLPNLPAPAAAPSAHPPAPPHASTSNPPRSHQRRHGEGRSSRQTPKDRDGPEGTHKKYSSAYLELEEVLRR